MNHAPILIAFHFATLCLAQAPNNVRKINVTDSEVTQIKTATGFSTILEFDTRPNSAVLGNQGSFKVEYVDNSITLKPLHKSAKTNLFVFTEYDRFNFTLLTTEESKADYIVQVKRQREPKPSLAASNQKSTALRETKTTATVELGGLKLTLKSIAWPKSESSLILRFQVTKTDKKPTTLQLSEESFELREKGSLIPYQHLYFDNLSLSQGNPLANGTMIIRHSRLKSKDLSLVLRNANAEITLNFSAPTN